MDKIRISAVSYTNTAPFVYGISHSDILFRAVLTLDTPSACAQKLIDNEADIGLIPVAALPDLPGYNIVSDYCIGADGAVNSVFIFSTKPIDQVQTLRLDEQSRTSNNLAKVLLKHHWNLRPDFVSSGSADAFVQIGDRTFGKVPEHQFAYDLAEEWKIFTGLPFLFAVWASNKTVDTYFLDDFNRALKYGLDHRDKVIAGLPARVDFDLDDYLMNRIRFNLDTPKMEALNKFLELVRTL